MATAKQGNYETVVAGVQHLNLKLALLVIPVQFIRLRRLRTATQSPS